MLKDNLCSVYEYRPKACRWAASGDAMACFNGYMLLSKSGIPTPMLYVYGRGEYELALWVASDKAGLASRNYEMNAALARALDMDNAERRWLSGEDIFADVLRETRDETAEQRRQFSEMLFGQQ